MTVIRVPRAHLEPLVIEAFVSANTAADTAESVARALIDAEIDGQTGHGLTRIASYTLQSRAGKVDGHAKPSAEEVRPGALMIDAAHGFAYPAIDIAVATLPDCATRSGIAAAGITRSHHCGAVGRHVERLAEAGLIAIFFANTPKAIAPAGGTRPLFGTNPIAFAAPRANGDPIIIDMALSEVARGRILKAAEAGEAIPEGWAVDADGRPTTDPKAALAGTLMPIGGAKGAALALMVEILAVAVTGSRFATEASSFFDDNGGPPGVGQFVITIDPAAFAGRDTVLERIEDLAAQFADNGEARLPGSRLRQRREDAAEHGVAVPAAIMDALNIA